MKIRIVCVGKLKERFWKEARDEYVKKLRGVGVEVEEVEVSESSGEAEKCQREESEKILVKTEGASVLCDRVGKQVTSEELAGELRKVGEREGRLTIIIGGSHGVSDEVREKADSVVGMGKVTWPHQMMRVMVLEQVYRSVTIWRGKEYHK